VDRYVVHVDHEGSTRNLFVEYRIHHGLKGGGRVGESEEHYRWLEESLIGHERRFVLVFRCNSDRVISPSYVDCGDKFRIA
jgi:hypothetical protein